MVFLAFTRQGLDESISLCTSFKVAIWCGSNVLTEAEYFALSGVNISRFIYSLESPEDTSILDALDTIAKHHPNEKIWVENMEISKKV